MPEDTNHLTPPGRAVRPLAHLVLGLALLTGLFVAIPVASADAAGSAAAGPSDEYVPHRVWQMKKNCVWAAGAMLVDKWTHGGTRVSQGVLRRASNDRKGGSSLYDLARGVAAVTGIRMSFSPGYGDTMAWWQLLDRLDHGGGAVLIGEYSKLPAHYSRWQPSFAHRRNSSHAVYVQSYDRVRGRVWLMDPLAEGHYPGEWISVGALHRFATIEDGKVMAAATPARHTPTSAPLVDHAYRLAGLRLTGRAVAGSTVGVKVSLSIGDGFPNPTPQRFVGRWDPVVPSVSTNSVSRSRAVIDNGPAPGTVAAPDPVQATTLSEPDRAGRNGFQAALPVPAIPGVYRLHLGLAEVDKKTPSRTFKTIDRRGPRALLRGHHAAEGGRGRGWDGAAGEGRDRQHRHRRLAAARGRQATTHRRSATGPDAPRADLARQGRHRAVRGAAADRPGARPGDPPRTRPRRARRGRRMDARPRHRQRRAGVAASTGVDLPTMTVNGRSAAACRPSPDRRSGSRSAATDQRGSAANTSAPTTATTADRTMSDRACRRSAARAASSSMRWVMPSVSKFVMPAAANPTQNRSRAWMNPIAET